MTSPHGKYRPPHVRARLREKASQANSNSLFFKLPRELRDQVYRELVGAGHEMITVEPSNSAAKPPALSQVCAQLRVESADVFFRNRFCFMIADYNIDTYSKWRKAMRSYMALRGPRTTWKMRLFWNPMFSEKKEVLKRNLLRCFEYGFDKHCELLEQKCVEGMTLEDHTPLNRSRINLFSMVKALKKQGLAWEKVQVTVEYGIEAAMICGESRV